MRECGDPAGCLGVSERVGRDSSSSLHDLLGLRPAPETVLRRRLRALIAPNCQHQESRGAGSGKGTPE